MIKTLLAVAASYFVYTPQGRRIAVSALKQIVKGSATAESALLNALKGEKDEKDMS